MDEHSSRLIEALQHQLKLFQAHEISLKDIQNTTEVISHFFENELEKELPRNITRLAGALEHIRWMSVPEDQFSNAVDKIREFEAVLSNWFKERAGELE